MAAAGVPVDESLVVNGGYRPETAEGPAARACSARADRPTAVFATNDLSAIRTMQVALELGLGVPEDLSVIGFDNVPESALATPPLTTMQPAAARDGRHRARDPGADAGRARTPRSTHVRLPTSMVERASCAQAAQP